MFYLIVVSLCIDKFCFRSPKQMQVYPKRIGAGVSLLLLMFLQTEGLPTPYNNKNRSKRTTTYANIAYMYVAQGTPFRYERAHLCRVYIHVIVGVHCHLTLTFHLKFRISNASEAKRSKRLILKRYCQSPDLAASISLPAIQENDATKVTKRIGIAKLSGYFLHYWT